MSEKYIINGRFLTRRMTGVDRFAHEIVKGLDYLDNSGKLLLAVPSGSEIVEPIDLSNIEIVDVGSGNGHKWEQTHFASFVKNNDATAINLCNTAPLLHPGIVCIHDVQIRRYPENFSKKFVAAYRIILSQLTRNADIILTVSDFSKNEIEHFYPQAKGKIVVVPNGWQHLNDVESDDETVNRFCLPDGEFWFAMSSISPNKNLKWIAETAKQNPGQSFAVAGGINTKVFGESAIPEVDNVTYLGYVSDEEAKALLESCKGFLFPTFYEGFGIPPLEAAACGARSLVSDSDVMHEVYERTVAYIDPNSPLSELDDTMISGLDPLGDVLKKYNWEDSAKKLLDLLE